MAETDLERCARAIYETNPIINRGKPVPWSDMEPGDAMYDGSFAAARAVLSALREPSEGMRMVGAHKLLVLVAAAGVPFEEKAAQTFQAMIDAALAEKG